MPGRGLGLPLVFPVRVAHIHRLVHKCQVALVPDELRSRRIRERNKAVPVAILN